MGGGGVVQHILLSLDGMFLLGQRCCCCCCELTCCELTKSFATASSKAEIYTVSAPRCAKQLRRLPWRGRCSFFQILSATGWSSCCWVFTCVGAVLLQPHSPPSTTLPSVLFSVPSSRDLSPVSAEKRVVCPVWYAHALPPTTTTSFAPGNEPTCMSVVFRACTAVGVSKMRFIKKKE